MVVGGGFIYNGFVGCSEIGYDESISPGVRHYMVDEVERLDQINASTAFQRVEVITSFSFFQFSADHTGDIISFFTVLSSCRCDVDGTKQVNLIFLDNNAACSPSSFGGNQRVQ